MSDATTGSAGDFRGSREEKRQDETVMINSDNLTDMVSQAKTDPAAKAPAAGASDGDSRSGPNMIVIGVGIALLLVVVIALVYEYATS